MCSVVSHIHAFAYTIHSVWNVFPLLEFLKKSPTLPSRLPSSNHTTIGFYHSLLCVPVFFDCTYHTTHHTEMLIIYLLYCGFHSGHKLDVFSTVVSQDTVGT